MGSLQPEFTLCCVFIYLRENGRLGCSLSFLSTSLTIYPIDCTLIPSPSFSSFSKVRSYLEWLGEKLGFKNKEDWYQISASLPLSPPLPSRIPTLHLNESLFALMLAPFSFILLPPSPTQPKNHSESIEEAPFSPFSTNRRFLSSSRIFLTLTGFLGSLKKHL